MRNDILPSSTRSFTQLISNRVTDENSECISFIPYPRSLSVTPYIPTLTSLINLQKSRRSSSCNSLNYQLLHLSCPNISLGTLYLYRIQKNYPANLCQIPSPVRSPNCWGTVVQVLTDKRQRVNFVVIDFFNGCRQCVEDVGATASVRYSVQLGNKICRRVLVQVNPHDSARVECDHPCRAVGRQPATQSPVCCVRALSSFRITAKTLIARMYLVLFLSRFI